MRSQRFSMLCRSAILAGAALAGVLGTAGDVMAQALKDVQTPDTPLVLKAQGSFFVGGEKAEDLDDLPSGTRFNIWPNQPLSTTRAASELYLSHCRPPPVLVIRDI